MYEFITPTDEIIELLASDVTKAISPEELKELCELNNATIVLVDGKTYIALMVKGEKLIVLAINGGGTDLWLEHVITTLNDLAYANCCSHVKFMGRRGWKRKLEAFNYKETGIIMEYKVVPCEVK